jgi:hypothetical protein
MTDIIRGTNDSYVVVGFFTPDYRPLAARLAGDLSKFDIPHHFYASTAAEWHAATLLKPVYITRARAEYPGKTIVSMDVDCSIKEPVASGLAISADVGLAFNEIRERTARLYPTSRVTVWSPTIGATKLLDKWSELCRRAEVNNDEILLMVAIARTAGTSLQALPETHRGLEWSKAPANSAIVHDSARVKAKSKNVRRRLLRATREFITMALFGTTADDRKLGKRLS